MKMAPLRHIKIEKISYSLTKSRFCSGVQCIKKLYLEKYHRDLAAPVDEAKQRIFDQGTDVGREAKKLMRRVLGRKHGAIHIWRHSALTLMLRKGADIETVRRVAGHSSLSVTQRYCHSNDVAMQRAIDKIRSSVHFGKNWAILGNRANLGA